MLTSKETIEKFSFSNVSALFSIINLKDTRMNSPFLVQHVNLILKYVQCTCLHLHMQCLV